MDVVFILQRQYNYHKCPSPSMHSFLAEMPKGIWLGCDPLAGNGGRWQPVHGDSGAPHTMFRPGPLGKPAAVDHRGVRAAYVLGRGPFLQQYKAPLPVQQTYGVLHALIFPLTGTVAALPIQSCHWIILIKNTYF